METQSAHLFEVDLIDPATGQAPSALPVAGRLTPPQIAIAYNIPSSSGFGVKIGILSFGGGFLQSDLNKSWADLQSAGLLSSAYTVPTVAQVLLDGQTGVFSRGNTFHDGASGENTVDIFCAATMAPQASITIYIGSTYQSMLTQAIADGMHIITISWATNEYTSDEQYFTNATNAGITVLAASGDWGSVVGTTGSTIGLCYPASSPNVISVGGTKLTLNGSNGRLTETDDNRDSAFGSTWGGGGGVSTVFSLPSWQSGLFYTPITSGVTGSPTALSNRGAPDFSAPMNAYALYYNGSISGYGGTSLSSPTMAGMLARFQQLTGVRRTSADWNTIAYGNTSAFYDITVGTNNTVINSGYAGTVGWDAVTGLGPPNGTSIYKSIHTGSTFPKQNYGFRPVTGQTYPRKTTGVR
jgi:kumamolisin